MFTIIKLSIFDLKVTRSSLKVKNEKEKKANKTIKTFKIKGFKLYYLRNKYKFFKVLDRCVIIKTRISKYYIFLYCSLSIVFSKRWLIAFHRLFFQ